jgi:hypothetical protein
MGKRLEELRSELLERFERMERAMRGGGMDCGAGYPEHHAP